MELFGIHRKAIIKKLFIVDKKSTCRDTSGGKSCFQTLHCRHRGRRPVKIPKSRISNKIHICFREYKRAYSWPNNEMFSFQLVDRLVVCAMVGIDSAVQTTVSQQAVTVQLGLSWDYLRFALDQSSSKTNLQHQHICYHHSRDMENSRGCAPISRDIQIPGLFDDLVITNSGILKNHGMYFMLIFGMNSLMLHCI